MTRRRKNIDIFAQPVLLLINSEEGHKTLFGASLTLGLIVLMIYYLIINLYTLSLKKNPSSVSTSIYHQNPDYYVYDSSNFTMVFAFENQDSLSYIDESIYIPSATLSQKVLNMVNGSLVESWISKKIPLIPCTTDLIRQQGLKSYFSNFDLPTYYCINWDKIDKLELQGQFTSDQYSQILVQFYMCTEVTKKSQECQPKEEIIKALKQNYLSFQFSSVIVDMKNSEQPFTPIGTDLYTTISSQVYKELSISLEQITMLTDFGLIAESYEISQALKYKDSQEIIDLNESDLLMIVNIKLDTTEQQQDRSYKKIQSIFGELGGLWSLLFTVAFYILKPIKQLSYYLRILNSLFEFEQSSEYRDNLTVIEEGQQELCSNKAQNTQLQQTKADKRLQSIKMKKEKLDNLQKLSNATQQDLETKHKLTKAISNSIKKYFQIISQKLKLKWTDYFFYFYKLFKKHYFKQPLRKKDMKTKQISFSVKKVIKQMDILFIMKKLQEIDKLKFILFTDQQIKVFDYLQKPKIPEDPKALLVKQPQYFSILKPVKSAYQLATDAQVAFTELTDNLQDPINVKLINSINPNILELLKLKNLQDFENVEESISEQVREKKLVPRIDVKQKRKTSYF